MKNKRYATSFFISLVIYISFIASFVYATTYSPQPIGEEGKNVVQIIQYQMPQKKTPPQEKPQLKPKPPEPKPKKKPEPKPLPQKIEPKVMEKSETLKADPIQLPHEETIQRVEEVEELNYDSEFIESVQNSTNILQQMSDEAAANAKKELFLHRLKEEIEKNKNYPPVALRRGLEGSVKINLTILDDGKMQNLKLDSNHRAFENATAQALQKVFPLSFSYEGVKLPLEVSFVIEYRLR